jgi:hypothetical protein
MRSSWFATIRSSLTLRSTRSELKSSATCFAHFMGGKWPERAPPWTLQCSKCARKRSSSACLIDCHQQ